MVTVRKATTQDFPEILNLITALAIFEKAEDQVINSVEQMIEEQDFFECFVAIKNDEVVGIALYYFAYYTWVGKSLYLDDLYVKEDLRGQGIGKLLLKEIFRVAREENCKRLRWQVLEWNTPAIDFYKSLKANIDTEWYNCDFSSDEMDIL